MYPWQENSWNQLMHQIDAERFPHALMLCGQAGIGKLDFAKALSYVLLCGRNKTKACGNCKSCHLLSQQSHPDFFLIRPQEKSKVIKVDQLRSLIDSLTQTANRGGSQVVIIEPLEAMHRSAANALLKVLEEPPGEVYFLLVSHRQGALLPTIVSRCQRLALGVKDEAQAIAWLQQQTTSDDPQLLFKIADRAPLRALHLQREQVLGLRDSMLNELQQIQQEQACPIKVAETWVKHDHKTVLTVLFSLYADCSKLLLGLPTQDITHHDRQQELAAVCKCLTQSQCQDKLDEVLSASRLLESSMHLNPQLMMEGLLC